MNVYDLLEEKETLVDLIFTRLWKVKVPRYTLLTDREIEKGISISTTTLYRPDLMEDEDDEGTIDISPSLSKSLDELTVAHLPISRLAEINHDALPILMLVPEQIYTVYQIIQEYNVVWADKLNNGNGTALLTFEDDRYEIIKEDLKKLNNLAQAIFNKNKALLAVGNNENIESGQGIQIGFVDEKIDVEDTDRLVRFDPLSKLVNKTEEIGSRYSLETLLGDLNK